MSFGDPVLRRLVTAYEAGRLVPFIGAGMSRPACADWGTLVRKLEASSWAPRPIPSLDRRADDDLPTGLIRRANGAVRRLKSRGIDAYVKAMTEAVIDEGLGIPPQTLALARLWWPLVLTTNYDNYFASALAKQYPNRPFVCVGRNPEDCQRVLGSLSTAGRGIVWALQGFLDTPEDNPEGPGGWTKTNRLNEQLVLGHEEYRRVTYRDIHFRRAFAEVYRQRSLLFLGSGLKETYLQELFGEVLELHGPGIRPHYAILPAGEVDPQFMAARFQISVIEYRKDEHSQVEKMLTELAEAVEAAGRPQVSWSWGRIITHSRGFGATVPQVEVVRGPLPPGTELSANWKPLPEECLAVSAGGSELFLFSPGIQHVMSHWGVAQDEQPSQRPRELLGYYPPQHVYAVRARSHDDRRGLLYVHQAMTQLLEDASQRYLRIHLQLLASGGVDKLNSQLPPGHNVRPFPPRFAFVEIIRAFADWQRRPNPGNCQLSIYIVDSEVYMELGSGRIDVPELLHCMDVRFWAEVATASGGIERRLFQEAGTKSLGEVADELNLSPEYWKVEVTPPPDVIPEVLPLSKREHCDRSLQDVGVVPGSTLHFRRICEGRAA